MYKFIKIQYKLGRITAEQVAGFVPKWITADQAVEICGTEGTRGGST